MMKFSMTCVKAWLALSLVVVVQAAAQDPLDHLRGARVSAAEGGPGFEGTRLVVEENMTTNFSQLKWEKWVSISDTFVTVATAQLPFHRAGGLAGVPGILHEKGKPEYLIGGLKYNSWSPVVRRGVMARVKLSAAGDPLVYSIEILNVTEYPGMDPYELAICLRAGAATPAPVDVYVVDRNAAAVKRAEWMGPGASLPLESSFAQVVDSTQLPGLLRLWGGRAGGVSARPSPKIEGPMVLQLTANREWEWRIDGSGLLGAAPAFGHWCVRNDWLATSQDPLELFVFTAMTGAASYEVVDLFNGNTVTTGSVTKDSWFSLVGGSYYIDHPLHPCEVRVLDASGAPVGAWGVSPFLSYGQPVSSANMVVRRARIPAQCVSGDTLFGHGVGFQSSLAGVELPVTVTLWTGVRGPSGDPVQVSGSIAVLTPAVVESWVLDPAGYGREISVNFPIPETELMPVGTVLLWQYVFTSASQQQLAFSEVFGAEVLPSGGVLALNSGEPVSKSAAQVPRRAVSVASYMKAIDAFRWAKRNLEFVGEKDTNGLRGRMLARGKQ